jgi:hypothetical protein
LRMRQKAKTAFRDKGTGKPLIFKGMRQARKQRYYSIPFRLALTIGRERLFREFQVWLLLKHWSNGRLEITPGIVGNLASSLKCSTKTIRRTIEKLRARNWLGFNPKTGVSYVRGMNSILIVEKIPGRLIVRFDVNEILAANAFFAACMDSFFVRGQKIKAWKERAARVHPKRGTTQLAPLPSHYPVALSLHEQFFGLSRTTAQRNRKEASRAGYLEIRQPPPIQLSPKSEKAHILEGYPELTGYTFERGGKLFLRQTDEICTRLNFGRRRGKKHSELTG